MELEFEPDVAIDRLAFSILSPFQIEAQSVCEITDAALYERRGMRRPKRNGLCDLRMGTSDWRLPCETCGHGILKCPGHPGHMSLHCAVYHAGFLSGIIKVLRCVCFFCSRLLLDDATRQHLLAKQEQHDQLLCAMQACKTKHTCVHCGAPQPKYYRAGNGVRHDFAAGAEFASEADRALAETTLCADTVAEILEAISDEDTAAIGLRTRPEWMVLTKLYVPPPIIRPSIRPNEDSCARGEDDITLELQDIFKINAKLASATKPADRRSLADELQSHISMYIHHDTKSTTTTGGAANFGRGPPHSNRERRFYHKRLKGKPGRIRRNLSGKRVNYCARSVVSPAPTYDIDEVGVPRQVALRLTFMETVNRWNLDKLTQRVRNGAGRLDGAVRVVDANGLDVDLKLIGDTKTVDVRVGMQVERYMQNGDTVLFNRQPSLHKMSIMAHCVRLTDDLTFRLPVCNATPFNADFDGDEMNCYAVQSVESHAEQRSIMSVRQQIVNPQNNKPIVALIQDSLISAYLMTSADAFLSQSHVMQLMMQLRHQDPLPPIPTPAVLAPRPLWTGKQIFSFLLPPTLHLARAVRDGGASGVCNASDMDMDERYVLIREGQLLCGSVCKKMVGTVSGGIVQVLVNDFGNDAAANFLGDAQRLLVAFMLQHGFSVGIRDCIANPAARKSVRHLLAACTQTVLDVEAVAQETHNVSVLLGDADTDVDAAVARGDNELETCLRATVQNVLSSASTVLQRHLPAENNIVQLVQSGAKGTPINIAQIMGCVGQQSVEGKRIRMCKDRRTLPCYEAAPSGVDERVKSRGFVCENYADGLSAQSYFFHAMGGREGLVDTAVKTAQTGYIQRRLMKAQETLQVHHDHTVRNHNEAIVQSLYGGDGLDPLRLERASVWTSNQSDEALVCRVENGLLETTVFDSSVRKLACEEARLLAEGRDLFHTARRASSALHSDIDNTLYVPVHMPRLLMQIQTTTCGLYDADALQLLVQAREAFVRAVERLRGADAAIYYVIYFRANLHVGVLAQLGLSAAHLQTRVLAVAFHKYERALVQAGEMVGAIGASAIGEPCTQMTLNTFHFSGVASKNVTLGVPRLKELIDAIHTIKTPVMTFLFRDPYASDAKRAGALARSLEHMPFGLLVAKSELLRENDAAATAGDKHILELHEAMYGSARSRFKGAEGSIYCLRFTLRKHMMYAKQLEPYTVAACMRSCVEDAHLVWSEVNADQWVVRLRLMNIDALLKGTRKAERAVMEQETNRTVLDHMLNNLYVHGVPRIAHTTLHAFRDAGCDGRTCYGVYTTGSNLAVLLQTPGIVAETCITNDVAEVCAVLGIEAAVGVLVDEIRAVLSFDGAYVDEHHIHLLVDMMTHSGRLSSVTRHDMHSLGATTYQRASYEESTEVLLSACLHNACDKLNGVTDRVIMGQRLKGGSGLSAVSNTAAYAARLRLLEGAPGVEPIAIDDDNDNDKETTTAAFRVPPMREENDSIPLSTTGMPNMKNDDDPTTQRTPKSRRGRAPFEVKFCKKTAPQPLRFIGRRRRHETHNN